jgi:hypothetical protein
MLADYYFGRGVGWVGCYRVVGVDLVVGMASEGMDCLELSSFNTVGEASRWNRIENILNRHLLKVCILYSRRLYGSF